MASDTSSERVYTALAYLFVLAFAVWVRVPTLSEGFWIDEVMSAAIISDPWALMMTRIGFTDVHPPGYYILLKAWSGLWGESDLALRSLSMVAGLGTLLLVMSWLRTRAGWPVALFGGLLLACSPFHSHYSVEVRAYALFTLSALALAWRLERWLEAPTTRGLRTVILLEVLTLGLHYYGLLWVALLNLYVFGANRLRAVGWRRQWLKGQCLSLSVLACWLPLLFVQVFELPEVMKAHLSDTLPFSRILAALGPFPSLEASLFAIISGGGLVMLALWGAWSLSSDVKAELETPPQDAEPVTLASGLVIASTLLIMPLFALILLPMSESLLEAYLRQLPWAYGAIVAVVVLGVIAAWARPLQVRLPLVPWLMLAGPLLVLLMHQLQPMLFLRNLLVFVPLVVLCASWSLRRAPSGVPIALCCLLLAVAGLHRDQGSEGFMPRQDFKGAIAALAEAPDEIVLVAPAWDAEGVSRYAGGQRIVPVMSSEEVARATSAANSVVVLLARPERLALSMDDVDVALGADWERGEAARFRGHRGAMQWLRYRRVAASP
jgi:uncharacterized membrane protein